MKVALLTLGIVLGVVVIVNLVYHLFSRRGASAGVESAPEDRPVAETVGDDESLLILKPLDEQAEYRRTHYPLQELVDDVESDK